MAHAEECPICKGSGKLREHNIKKKVRNGRGGKGWIEVSAAEHIYFPKNTSIIP